MSLVVDACRGWILVVPFDMFAMMASAKPAWIARKPNPIGMRGDVEPFEMDFVDGCLSKMQREQSPPVAM